MRKTECPGAYIAHHDELKKARSEGERDGFREGLAFALVLTHEPPVGDKPSAPEILPDGSMRTVCSACRWCHWNGGGERFYEEVCDERLRREVGREVRCWRPDLAMSTTSVSVATAPEKVTRPPRRAGGKNR